MPQKFGEYYLEFGCGCGRVLGVPYRPADYDVVRAIFKRLLYTDNPLLIVGGSVLHGSYPRGHDEQLRINILPQLRRLQTG